MARLVHDGNRKIFFVPTIEDIEAPTLGEIDAGTHLTPFLTKDGANPNHTTNNVDNGTLNSSFDAQEIGTWGAEWQFTMFRDDTDDDAWDLVVRGTRGYIVDSPFGTPEAASEVSVYPVAMHHPAPQPSATNENQRFVANMPVTSEPELKATVAAS